MNFIVDVARYFVWCAPSRLKQQLNRTDLSPSASAPGDNRADCAAPIVSSPDGFLARNRFAVLCALLTVTFSFGWFLMDGDVALGLADEGYLWYGMRALNAGQVPIRDFHAYDPGRYVWVAAWSTILGEGVVSMRASCVIFQCLGVFCGLLAAGRLSRDWKFIVIVALTLVLWMLPRYKVFEQSIALMAIYVAVRLIERPTLRQHFFTGTFIGLMAFMGRNHGLYQLIAFGLVIMISGWGQWRTLLERIGACAGGIVLGYAPQLIMFAAVPGYFHAFIDILRYDLTVGTNLGIPVPWPWRVPANFGPLFRTAFIFEGCFYVALPLLFVAFIARLFQDDRVLVWRHPLVLAGIAVTLPYAHYTFSRADYVHLAHAAPALVLATLALAATFRTKPWLLPSAALALFLGTIPAVAMHTGFIAESITPAGSLVPVRVLNQTMFVPRRTAAVLDIATVVATKLAKQDEAIAFLPHWPALYPATNRLSPLKQTYFIRPSTPAEEAAIIESLERKRVQWVLLQDERIDNRDDLRFKNTNPRTHAYFRANFDIVAVGAGLNAKENDISTYSDFRTTIDGFLSAGRATDSNAADGPAPDIGEEQGIYPIHGLAHDTLLLRRKQSAPGTERATSPR
jgi:hypothetical protein